MEQEGSDQVCLPRLPASRHCLCPGSTCADLGSRSCASRHLFLRNGVKELRHYRALVQIRGLTRPV